VALLGVFAAFVVLALLFGMAAGGFGSAAAAPSAQQWATGYAARLPNNDGQPPTDEAEDAATETRSSRDRMAAVLEQQRLQQERIDQEYLDSQRDARRLEQEADDHDEEVRLAERFTMEASQ